MEKRTLSFVISGDPRPKGRPKFFRRGNFVGTYTPKETVSYENLVRTSFIQIYHGAPIECPIAIGITAYFAVPKSYPKKVHSAVKSGCFIPKITKPDLDNIVKAVTDGLNSVAYGDDAQIYSIMARKFFSDRPRVEVDIICFNNGEK